MASCMFSGARLIWLVNKASWSVVTAQVSCPSWARSVVDT